jgi:uncharacterized Zn finger protein
MTVPQCPSCDSPTPRLLDHIRAFVDYYQCDGCGHVWTTAKQDGSFVSHVTPFRKAKSPKEKKNVSEEEAATLSPMPVPPCPSCDEMTAHHLGSSSRNAFVNYYSCQACLHIWTIDKRHPSKVTHITPAPETRKDRRAGQ